MNFQIVMFAVPFVLMIIATFIYKRKVTLTETEHAKIVKDLEQNWDTINK